jgi:hypothetical protein
MQLKVPTSLVANAPTSIPLWYYDEAKEMWVEEGSATLQGDTYIGNVAHFSFWNCDSPAAAIFLEMIIQDQHGNPLTSAFVSLTNTTNYDTQNGISNSSGWVGGLVYQNATLDLAIYASDNLCTSSIPLYTQTITTSSVNQNLGIITVNVASQTTATINGNLIDCLGQQITNSIVIIQPFGLLVYPNVNGQFSYSIPCTPTVPVTLYSYDLSSNVYGTSTTSLVTGTNNLGSLIACGQNSEFLSISLTNTANNITATKIFSPPLSTFSLTEYPLSSVVEISVSNLTSMQSSSVTFESTDKTIGTFPSTYAMVVGIAPFNEAWFTGITPCSVTFFTFPSAPEAVFGSFNLTLNGLNSGDTYIATGSFRVNRP